MKKDKAMIKEPKDKSVEAYKEWILAIRFAITGEKSDGSELSESKWASLTEEYWKDGSK